ncbi:MAG: hypothetical protein HYV63_05165 [Candidatus Schekmanbacteria bacterium]|nr:hypothetical protein [Candidatus Schekmanbacteria bacterium]
MTEPLGQAAVLTSNNLAKGSANMRQAFAHWLGQLAAVISLVACLGLAAHAEEEPLGSDERKHASEPNSPSSGYDRRVKSLLDAHKMKYTITGSGDFEVWLEVAYGRTQHAAIRSGTVRFRSLETREVLSPAYRVSGGLPGEMANMFLELNSAVKVGAFTLTGEAVFYCTRVDANADWDTLYDVLLITVLTADDMEKQLTRRDKL